MEKFIPSCEQLEFALAEQHKTAGMVCDFDSCTRETLRFAYSAVTPQTHTEAAFVAWSAGIDEGRKIMIEEYCRRRRSESALLFDHPILEMKHIPLPYTQRLLVFREQIDVLASELTGTSPRDSIAFQIYRAGIDDISTRIIGRGDFRDMVTEEYRHALTDNDIDQLYDLIQTNYRVSLPYWYCSGIVERALKL